MTRAGLPLHRILQQPRRVRRDFWRKHGKDTFLYLLLIALVALPLLYGEWVLP